MWLLIKANFALLSQFCYEEISTILSKCDRKMFVSKINNPHCHVWPSLLAACTWRRIRSIQQKWWSESEKCCCSYSCCKSSACMLLWLKVYFTKKDDTAGSGWWWGVSGVAGWHLRGARGCGDARRQQPCAHAAFVRLVIYGISSSSSMCLIWNRSIRTWSLSRDEFCSFKKEKITKYCYVSLLCLSLSLSLSLWVSNFNCFKTNV